MARMPKRKPFILSSHARDRGDLLSRHLVTDHVCQLVTRSIHRTALHLCVPADSGWSYRV